MGATPFEVLKANVVLVGVRLLGTPEQTTEFRMALDTECKESNPIPGLALSISTPGLPSNLDLVPKTLTIGRDRITLQLIPDRTIVEMEYPRCDTLERLNYVTSLAYAHSAVSIQNLRAVGFNLEAVYQLSNGETAGEFMSNRIFSQGLVGESGFKLRGGSTKLHLVRGRKQWVINIEPRLGDNLGSKIFVNMNLHFSNEAGPVMPSQEFIGESLSELWNQAQTMMDDLQ